MFQLAQGFVKTQPLSTEHAWMDLKQYFTAVRPKFLSYDYYQWWWGTQNHFGRLEAHRAACQPAGDDQKAQRRGHPGRVADRPRHSRPDLEDFLLPIRVVPDDLGHLGPRADDAHVAAKHVPELRDLVEPGLAKDASDARDAQVTTLLHRSQERPSPPRPCKVR